MRRLAISAFCLVFACLASGGMFPAPGDGPAVVWSVDFRKEKGRRVVHDFPFEKDVRFSDGISFDFYCTDPTVCSSYFAYFRSGRGWYRAEFTPRRAGEWQRVTIGKGETELEGRPDGWRCIQEIRVAVSRARSAGTLLACANFAPAGEERPLALVLRAESQMLGAGEGARDAVSYSQSVLATLRDIHIPAALVSDGDLAGPDDIPPTVRLMVLPCNAALPRGLAETLKGFGERGGKFMAFYLLPRGLEPLLGLRVAGSDVAPRGETFEGFERIGEGLPGQPAFVPQASWRSTVVRPTGEGRAVAFWRRSRAAGSPAASESPAVTVTPGGAFFGHVWFGGDVRARRDLLRSVIGELLPNSRGRDPKQWASVTAAAENAVEASDRAWLAAQPSRPGEERAFWCHSPWGLGGERSWEDSVRFLRENGFNEIIVNFSWGGLAYYPSRRLPEAEEVGSRGSPLAKCLLACRRHGVRCLAWKVCWNLGPGAPEKFIAQLAAENRLQKNFDGSSHPWLCPTDPRNVALEVAAFSELAKMPFDGVQLDYIRYPGTDFCFCDGCRARFERQLGRRLAKWPREVRSEEAVASAWEAFRCEAMTRAVRAIAGAVRAQNQKMELSAAVYMNADSARRLIAQPWDDWCREGLFDTIRPMDYLESPEAFERVVARQKGQAGKVRLFPGIGLSLWKGQRNAVNLAKQIGIVRSLGLTGYTVFNFDASAEAVLPALHTGVTRENN